jgi:hypothetical protein
MRLTREHLDAIRTVCRATGGRSLVYQATSGTLEGSARLTPELHAALDRLIRAGVLDDSLEVDGRFKVWVEVPPTSGQRVRIELPVAAWVAGSHVVYRNLDDLIRTGLFLTQAPAACYLVDEDLLLPPDKPSGPVAGYLQAVDLAQLLAEQADHHDQIGGKPRLIFLHKASLTLPIDYHVGDLGEPLEGLDQLRELLASGEHKEQKRSILKAVLYERLASEPTQSERFRRLLRHLPELVREFRERYQLFICEFDFEEVREELEEKRRDYLGRLNAAFHDMGAKLLSVPVAFYLAFTKMKPLPAAGDAFEALLLNVVVTLAVLLVSLYIWMLLNSHRHTLLATAEEYGALLARWYDKLQFPEQQAEVDKTRSALDRRKGRLLTYFRVTRWSIIATVLITLALFLMRVFRWEDPVWNALLGLKTWLLP